jgi:hypothetical protein
VTFTLKAVKAEWASAGPDYFLKRQTLGRVTVHRPMKVSMYVYFKAARGTTTIDTTLQVVLLQRTQASFHRGHVVTPNMARHMQRYWSYFTPPWPGVYTLVGTVSFKGKHQQKAVVFTAWPP